jgi:hypothetical protein
MLEAETILELWCGWKDYVNEKLCNECEIWKILFALCVTDVPGRVSCRMLEVRWFCAQKFDTPYRMSEQQTFLAYLGVSVEPKVRR